MAKQRIDAYPGYQCLSVHVHHAHSGARGRKNNNPAIGWVVSKGGNTLSPVFKQRWEAQAWAHERFLVAGWLPPSSGSARDPYKHLYAVPGKPPPAKPYSEECRRMYKSICDNPLDDTVRLATADLYDEEGHHDRAAFVRYMIAHPNESGRVVAAQGLNAQNMIAWCEDVARVFDHENIDPNGQHGYQETWGAFGIDYGHSRRLSQFLTQDTGPTTWGWSRGYVDSLVTTWGDFDKACAGGLFLLAPITSVRLFGLAPTPLVNSDEILPESHRYHWYVFGRDEDTPRSGDHRSDEANRYRLPNVLAPHLGPPSYMYVETTPTRLVRQWETPDPYGLLSAALVDYGRDRVGLPSIREQLFTGYVKELR